MTTKNEAAEGISAQYATVAEPAAKKETVVTFDSTSWTGAQVPSLPVRIYNAVSCALRR